MSCKASCFHVSTYIVVTSRFLNLKASQIGRNFSTLWRKHSKNSLIPNIKYAFDEYQKVITMELVAIIKVLIYTLNLAQKWRQNENIGLLKLDWNINNSKFTNLIWKMVQKVKKNDPKQTYISFDFFKEILPSNVNDLLLWILLLHSLSFTP